MSEQRQNPVRVDISVRSESDRHALAAGIIVARVLARAGITYISLLTEGPRTADGEEIARAEAIPQEEIGFWITARSNS